DGLEERIYWPSSGRQIERYAAGNPHALREVVTVYGERRELYFYKSRLDGLVKHVERFGRKISEEFEGREDGLIAHSVQFADISEANANNETIKQQKKDILTVAFLCGRSLPKDAKRFADKVFKRRDTPGRSRA
ncbi:hypothetical protein, conserved, partial [Eimeria acervulina]